MERNESLNSSYYHKSHDMGNDDGGKGGKERIDRNRNPILLWSIPIVLVCPILLRFLGEFLNGVEAASG